MMHEQIDCPAVSMSRLRNEKKNGFQINNRIIRCVQDECE